MAFIALDVSLDFARDLAEPLRLLERRDASLADQLRRAASSVSLNLAEGRGRIGRDRVQRWRIALGSAQEAVAALRLADAWGLLEPARVRALLGRADRLVALLWGLTH